ncbi:MAG: tetratricopeptide repeat protein [Planctomycetota bacterium JB042]
MPAPLRKLVLGLLVAAASLALLEAGARALGLGDRSALVRLEPAGAAGDDGEVRVRALGISKEIDHVSAPFPSEHREGATRIVLIGESAAAGFPFQPASTPARWLELRLGARRPDLDLEIVDTSIPGLQSDFFPPIARLAFDPPPDLVIVYAGNNEFLLSFLAVERARGAADRLVERLARSSAGVRWLRAALAPTGRALENPRNPLSTEVFYDEPLGPLRRRVLDRLARNLRTVVRLARDAGAEVLIARPAAALREAVPKSSVFAADVPEDARERFAALVEEARARTRRGDFGAADEAIAAAAHIDDEVAILHFRRGERLEAEGRLDEARDAYRRALDLDERPVRVNAATAAVLERVAAAEGVAYLDVDRAFADASPHGIVGEDLLVDHVHLTVGGQHRLAGHLIDALRALRLPDGEAAWTDDDVSLEGGVEALGLDRRTALHPEAQLGFLAVFLALESGDPEPLGKARRRFDRALERTPDEPLATAGRAVLAVAEGRADDAMEAFDRLAERSPGTMATLASMVARHAGLRSAFERAGLRFEGGRVVRTSPIGG